MNKKILIGALVCLILLLLFLIATTLFKQSEPSSPGSGGVFPTTTPVTTATTTTATLSIPSAQGTAIVVRNFLVDPRTVADPVNSGYYYLGNHAPFDGSTSTISAQMRYSILYIAQTGHFTITLLKEPLAQSRREAEVYLQDALGLSQEELCSLQYQLSVPNFVNTYFAGDSLGFSFCPGAIPLE